MGDIKQFLYAWCGKRKVTPIYEFGQTGSKHKPRFKCEVWRIKICFILYTLYSRHLYFETRSFILFRNSDLVYYKVPSNYSGMTMFPTCSRLFFPYNHSGMIMSIHNNNNPDYFINPALLANLAWWIWIIWMISCSAHFLGFILVQKQPISQSYGEQCCNKINIALFNKFTPVFMSTNGSAIIFTLSVCIYTFKLNSAYIDSSHNISMACLQ